VPGRPRLTRRWLGGRLDHEPREPLLRVQAEREDARQGGMPVGVQDPAAAQQLAAVGEPPAALRIEAADAAYERVHQVCVEVLKSGVADRQLVSHRGAAGGKERLLLQSRQQVVAVVAPQVRLARRRHPARLEGLAALMHACDDYRVPVDLRIADVEADGRDETPGL